MANAEIYLIGLGGAGTTIVESIFENNDDKISLKGLVVDIDNSKLDSINRKGLTTLPLSYEKGYNPRLLELYNSELHLENSRIIPPVDATGTGVGKNRRFARAIFKYNYHKEQLKTRRLLDRFGRDFANDSSAKCIFIISSLGGGSGSGILLELSKHIRDNLIDRQSETPVFGIGIMGAADDVSTHCKAATYATLMELKKSMNEVEKKKRPFDGFMLLDLEQVINKISDEYQHPIEQAQVEITTAITCFVNDFIGYQTNPNKNNVSASNNDRIDFNDFRSVLYSNTASKDFTFCTMNVDYTEFPVGDIKAYISCGNQIKEYESEIDESKNQIRKIRLDSIDPIKSKSIGSINNNLDEINQCIQTYGSDIDKYEKRFDEFDNEICELSDKKVSVTKNILNEQSNQLDYEKDLGNLSMLNRFTKKDVVVNLKENISTCKDKIVRHESSIKNIENEIDEIKDKKMRITDKITDIRLLRDRKRADQESQTKDLQKFNTQLGDLNIEIERHENEIDDRKKMIMNRRVTMKNLKTNFEEPDGRIVRSYPITMNSELYYNFSELVSNENFSINSIFKGAEADILEDIIGTTVRPAKYLDLMLANFKIPQVSVAFGMKANSELDDLKTTIKDRVGSILAPYTTNNSRIETYPYGIDDPYSIYGYAFFNNISLQDIFTFRRYHDSYKTYFLDNPDIHAYDVEYWENKVTDLERGDRF